jgi:signal transduction histidine kinase/ligand-binding sensor domain-containing protein
MRGSVAVLLIALVFLTPARVLAQKSKLPFFNHPVNVKLSQHTINDLFQDSYGYLWLATQDGLNRYNGYEVSIFRHQINDPNSLSENFTLCLAEDSKRNIWVGTIKGLNIWNRSTQKIHRVFLDTTNKENQPVSSILKVDSLQMAVISGGNLFVLSTAEALRSRQLSYPRLQGIGSKGWIDSGKWIWHTQDSELRMSDIKTGKTMRSVPFAQQARDFFLTIDQVLWIATDSGLYFLGPGMTRTQAFPATHRAFSGLRTFALGENDYELWVGGEQGINIIQKKNNGWFHLRSLTHDPLDAESIPVSQVFSLMKDQTGMTWVGTSHDGVFTRKMGGTLFSVFQHKHSDEPSLSSHINWSISQTRSGKYLIGSANGLNICDFNTSTGVLTENRLLSFKNHLQAPLSVFQVFELPTAELMIGTNAGLFLCNPENGEYQSYTYQSKPVHLKIMHLSSDSDGRIWCATSQGAYLSRPGSLELINPALELPKFSIPDLDYMSRVFQDKQGRIWLGSLQGFWAIDPKSGEVLLSLKDFLDQPETHQRQVSSFAQDSLGRIWFSTFGAGIFCMNEKFKTLTSYSEANGLSNNVVYSLLEDDEHFFWLTTNRGLMRFNPYTAALVTYHQEDGLPIEEFNQNGFYKDRNGYLFFSSTAGLVMKNQENKGVYNSPTPVVLTSIDINYEPMGSSHPSRKGLPFEELRKIDLNYADRVVSFEFSALDFRNSDRISYAYMLEGFNKNWVKVPAERRYVTYSSLPSGTYVLKVKAAIEKEQWNSNVLSLVIQVHPPFWATWWFIGGIALILLGIGMGSIYLFSRQRLIRKNQELSILRQVQEERERISRDLHDHVGAQITYMITKLDHLQFKVPQAQELPHRLEVISSQARSTMQLLRETIWAIRKEQVSLLEFTQKLKEYLSQMFTGIDHMTYELQSQEPLPERTLKPIKALNTFRIIQEAVTNSTKYSGGTWVKIQILENLGELMVEIADNGCGFSEVNDDPTGFHNGLENMRFRAEEMGGRLEFFNNQGAHVRLTVEV